MGNKEVLTNEEIKALKILLAGLAKEEKEAKAKNMVEVTEEAKPNKFTNLFKSLKENVAAASNKTVNAVKSIPRPHITFVKPEPANTEK